MTRASFALWLLAVIGLALAATQAHRQAQQPRQYPCPPECSDCGHSWASSKPVCKLKNLKGLK